VVKEIIDDYHSSIPDTQSGEIRFPGEGSLKNRQQNLAKGIPVNKLVWEEIKKL
jgi:LDH2 family malate/lactate/ureidoglycolate dehydrogenase